MLKPGDKLRFTRDLTNPVNFPFIKGDILTLIEPTDASPHGFAKTGICNWVVDGPNGRTIWTSIWYGLDKGWLEKVK